MSVNQNLFKGIREKWTANEKVQGKYRKFGSSIDFIPQWKMQAGMYPFVVMPLDAEKNPNGFELRQYHQITDSTTSPTKKVLCRLCLGDETCPVDEHLQAFFEAVEDGERFSGKTTEAFQNMIASQEVWLYVMIRAKKVELTVETDRGMENRVEYHPSNEWMPAILILSAKSLVDRFLDIALEEPGGENLNDAFSPPIIHMSKESNNRYKMTLTKERRPYTQEEKDKYISKGYPKMTAMGKKQNKESIEFAPEALTNILEGAFWYDEVFGQEQGEPF